MLCFFLRISARTKNNKSISILSWPFRAFLPRQKKRIDAVGNDKSIGRAGRIFKYISDKLSRIVYAITISINGTVKIFIDLFIEPLIIHHFDVIGYIFCLTMKTCRNGNSERARYFYSCSRKRKRNQQMYHVHIFDDFFQNPFFRSRQGDAVFFYISVEKQEVDFGNTYFVFHLGNIRFGTYDYKGMSAFFQKTY